MFETENGILYKYISEGEKRVAVPDGITVIWEEAFENTDVRMVILPEGVTTIGQNAFMNCTELKQVILPDSIAAIDTAAFIGCISLERLILPKSLNWIGASAFRACESLKEILLPKGLRYLGESVFSGCISLEKVRLPEGMTLLRKRLFSDCAALRELTLPDGVTAIDDYAFIGCAVLERITGGSLKSIGRHAFDSCGHLSEIEVKGSLGYIGSSAFYRTPLDEPESGGFSVTGRVLTAFGGGREADIPAGVRGIAEHAFTYHRELERVTVPEGVDVILEGAFAECAALESVTLPQSLKSIGAHAFEECTALEKTELPDDIEHIGERAFFASGVHFGCEGTLIISGKYLIAGEIALKEYDVPEGITVIADGAFSDSRGLERVGLPEGLVTVGAKAFMWCAYLDGVTLPKSVRHIGSEAFAHSGVKHAELYSESCADIGEGAFPEGCTVTVNCGDITVTADITENSPKALFAFAAEPTDESFSAIGYTEYSVPCAAAFYEKVGACRRYLADDTAAAICFSLDRGTDLLERLLSFGLLDARGAEQCIGRAIELERTEHQIMLMRYKRELTGEVDAANEAAARLEL